MSVYWTQGGVLYVLPFAVSTPHHEVWKCILQSHVRQQPLYYPFRWLSCPLKATGRCLPSPPAPSPSHTTPFPAHRVSTRTISWRTVVPSAVHKSVKTQNEYIISISKGSTFGNWGTTASIFPATNQSLSQPRQPQHAPVLGSSTRGVTCMIDCTDSCKEQPYKGGEGCLRVCLGENKRNNCSTKERERERNWYFSSSPSCTETLETHVAGILHLKITSLFKEPSSGNLAACNHTSLHLSMPRLPGALSRGPWWFSGRGWLRAKLFS